MSRIWREAEPAPWTWNLLKTFLWTLLFWFTFLGMFPWIIIELEELFGWSVYRFPSDSWRITGVVLFTIGGVLGPTSSVFMAVYGQGTPLPMDSARQLVIVGPYQFVRNPMALAGIAQGVAVGLYLGSPSVVAYAFTGAVLWHVLVKPKEEEDLLNRFGEPYNNYRKAVKCWIPRWKKYKNNPEEQQR